MALIQITAYLRNEEDLELWKALPNKTEWLHENLSQSTEPKIKESPRPSNDRQPRKKIPEQETKAPDQSSTKSRINWDAYS